MKRVLALSLLVLTAACMDDMPSPVAPGDANPQDALDPLVLQLTTQEYVVPGRLIVKLQSGVDAAQVARGHGLEVAGRGYRDAFVLMRGAAGSERAMAARLGTDARVEWAEPDYVRRPTDIDLRQWALYNPGNLTVDYTRGRNKGSPVTSYESTGGADVNVAGISTGGSEVFVGSIDTGVDFTHLEFTGVDLEAGHDFYDDDSDPSDSEGHGTHTTGTMVGNTVGVAGVTGTPVGVYVQRVCGPIGCPTSAIVDAIYAAADWGVIAMNLSLGGSSLSQAEAAAINYAANTKGALVIASAGNSGTGTVECPACDPNAISVAATNWQDELSYYSSYGPGLDLSAPGGELYSNTTEEAGIRSSVPGGYAYYQGTSMAAPHVTGVAGIVASRTVDRGADLRCDLEDSADDLGAGGYDATYGHGRVDAGAALTQGGCGSSGGGGDGGTGGGGTTPLTASISYACSKADCIFDGSGSTGEGSLQYAWTIDGSPAGNGVSTSTTFTSGGNHNVMLAVSDGSGTETDTVTVSCTRRGPNLQCR